MQVERVEKGVVLGCEENNKEGAWDMLCEDESFTEGLNASTTLRRVLSHARKNRVCGSVAMCVLMRVG